MQSTLRRVWLCLALGGVMVACATAADDLPAVSSVRVLDEQGTPLLARVVVSVVGSKSPELYAFFTSPDGTCDLEGVPEGEVEIEVNHGPEWTVETRAARAAAASPETLEIRLQRFYDLPAVGYYQGDSHMHSTYSDGAQRPSEVAVHCRAEGLHWAFLTDHDTLDGVKDFVAQATAGFLPMPGQEITTGWGHILGLGVTRVVSKELKDPPQDMTRVFREVREQGGVAVVAHPAAPLMGYRLWEVALYDALEVLNGSLPPYGSAFDGFQGRKRWHELLSENRRVAAVANSDNHDNLYSFVRNALRDPQEALRREPRLALLWALPGREEYLLPWARRGVYLGVYRTCLKLPELSQKAVLAGIKAGSGFITNGPLVVATLNGAPPGSQIAPGNGALHYDVACNRGLDRLDVLVDGTVAQTVDLTGKQRHSGDLTVALSDARWVTVECYGNYPDFASTNAWYVKR